MKPAIPRKSDPVIKSMGFSKTDKKPYSIKCYRGLKPVAAAPHEIRWKYSPGFYK